MKFIDAPERISREYVVVEENQIPIAACSSPTAVMLLLENVTLAKLDSSQRSVKILYGGYTDGPSMSLAYIVFLVAMSDEPVPVMVTPAKYKFATRSPLESGYHCTKLLFEMETTVPEGKMPENCSVALPREFESMLMLTEVMVAEGAVVQPVMVRPDTVCPRLS